MKTPFDEADKMRGGDNKGKRAFDEGVEAPLSRHPGRDPGSTFFNSSHIQRQVDFLHDPVGLDQDFDDLLIMANVVIAEHPPAPIFQPLLITSSVGSIDLNSFSSAGR